MLAGYVQLIGLNAESRILQSTVSGLRAESADFQSGADQSDR